jgi:protein-L-isoaspartate(D-aspartate) O-methyltransferase
MNLEIARFNMIEQQLRPWNVLDPVVLDLLNLVPRENFVPPQYSGLAYSDIEIPLGHDQSMLSPKIEARLLQTLSLNKNENVLEVGTGSGYLTALLASLSKHVYSVEIVPELSKSAAVRLRKQGIKNVTLEVGDGAQGWAKHASYDAILLGGSVPLLAPALQQSLNVGGRMIAVVGEAPVMTATLITRVSATAFRTDAVFETCIPSLVNAPQPERFTF